MAHDQQRVCQGGQPEQGADYTSKEIHGACGLGGGGWNVRNDINFPEGDISLAEATAKSINTAFVGMAIQLGGDPCKIRDTGWRMGLHQGNGKEILPTRRRSSSAPGRRPP